VFDARIEAVLDAPAAIGTTGVIVPGLVDSHTHPLETGLQAIFADVDGARSVDEVQQRLRSHRRVSTEHGMMLGFGLEPDKLRERRYPSRHDLDAVLPDVPVFVYRVDGHSAVVNTAGLQLLVAGWPAAKQSGVDLDCSGQPTGVLRGEAYETASRVFKHRLLPGTLREGLRLAGEQAAASGVTTIGALVGVEDNTEDEWQVLLEGLAASAVSAVPYLQTWDVDVPRRFGLKQAGGCLLIDGSFGSRTAALAKPYSDAPGNSGAGYVSDKQLLALLRAAGQTGLQTAVHAIGDRAVEQVVRCHEQLAVPGSPNPLRHRIEHAELLDDSLIDRIARLGLVLGVQPSFEAEWGGPDRMYRQRLGERWRNTNPYRRLLERGVVLAGGSDAPITPIDPVSGIRAALERPNPTERVSGEQALAMFTSAAAFALNRELVCGSIEAGKDADLTVLSADPRTAADSRVVATFRGGTCTYKDETLTEYLKLEV
jgi:predicted amidohydrolase YtcJ